MSNKKSRRRLMKNGKVADLKNLFANNIRSTLFIASFALIGVVLLFSSFAATPTANLDVENGTLGGNAFKLTDATASNGSAVQFGVQSYTTDINDTDFTYSPGWLTSTGPDKYLENDSYSITTNATATYTFTGVQIELYAAKDVHHGIAAVSIDNGTEVMIDMYAASRQEGVLLYTSPQLTAAQHTFKVRVTGNKNAASTNVVVAIDKAVIRNLGMSPTPPPPPPPPTTGSGKFYIVGKQIIGPDGKVFFPVGANVGIRIKGADVYGNWTSQGGSATGHVNDAKAWGWNIIRATLWCTPNNVSNNYATLNELLAATDDIINEYTAQKIVVMLECHDLFGNTNTDTNRAEFQPIHQFFTSAVARYKNNPYVWFNYMNEPLTEDIGDDGNRSKWVAFQENLYNRIRNAGTENIFVADLPNWAADLNSVRYSNYAADLSARTCNLLYSFHNYGYNDASYPPSGSQSAAYNSINTAYTAASSKNMPLITGEIGYDWNSSSARPAVGYWTYQWNRTGAMVAFDTAVQYGYGLLWWDATHAYLSTKNSDSQTFYMPSNSANLSEGGQRLWNLGQSKPTPATFTGNLANSRCPSAQ